VSGVTVRAADERDAGAIAAVQTRGWQTAYRGLLADSVLDGLSVEARAWAWREVLAAGGDDAATTVSEVDGAVVGFCALSTPARDADASPGTAEIAAIYVDPDRWRAGVGGALLGAALAQLERDGWERVTLWVLDGNDAARAFYARFGFAPDGATQFDERLGAAEVRLVRELGGAFRGCSERR
jgi:RimJ/RimL family protein N-acetyltransferase